MKCKYCDKVFHPNSIDQLCDPCWAFKTRIEHNLELTIKILAELMKEKEVSNSK
jgi:Zn finger protein HypA/HybF involved in hydrogenase expression